MNANLCNSIDCGRKPSEASAPRPLPAIDLMAKDYDSLLRAMLDQLPARAPGWSDRSEADLGMALLELFAYCGDQLSYLQDRVALEGFLRTATQFESVRKLLRLIDHQIDPGRAAQVTLVIECAGSAPLHLPAGFAVSTRASPAASAITFETGTDAVLVPAASRIALSVDAPSNSDGTQAVLASIDTQALGPGRTVLLESAGAREFAVIAARVIGGATTTLTFTAPLVHRYTSAGLLFGNVVGATHGVTQPVRAAGNGRPGQSVALEQAPLAYLPAGAGYESTLTVRVDGVVFTEVEDFVDSGAADTHFRITRDNAGYVTVWFGDGSRGRAPPAGAVIDIRYRHGGGEAGHVAAGTLTQFEPPAVADASQRVSSIRNPFAAAGGREPQTLRDAKLTGPRALTAQRRCVTSADFEALALQGVEMDGRHVAPIQANARLVSTGGWSTAVVSVDMADRRPLRETPALRAAFEERLSRFKLMGTEVRVENARYAPVAVRLQVEVKAEYFARDVRRAVERVLVGDDATSRAQAFFAAGRFRFGQRLHLSDLYSTVIAVQGVNSVAVTRFKRLGDRYADSEARGYIEVGELEVIRCDNDGARTENGVLFVRTCGGKDG